jgi:hypothetical protein
MHFVKFTVTTRIFISMAVFNPDLSGSSIPFYGHEKDADGTRADYG